MSLSDNTPSANADLTVAFAVGAPQAQVQSFATFIPSTFGVATDAQVSDGSPAGTLTATTVLGILNTACFTPLLPTFNLQEATADITNPTSSFDPTGPGFRDQFLPDPASPPDVDVGGGLITFDVKEGFADLNFDGKYTLGTPGETIYFDTNGDGFVNAGDVRLTDWTLLGPFAGIVSSTDADVAGGPPLFLPGFLLPLTLTSFGSQELHAENITVNGLYDNLAPGPPADRSEDIYFDTDGDSAISIGDVRLSAVPPFAAGTSVSFALTIAISKYPTYLDDNIPAFAVGPPRSRVLGTTNVAGLDVSITILTYNPGQLTLLEPAFTASLGFTVITLLNNPGAANIPSPITDFCATTSFNTTLLGVTADNPKTAADESGQVVLTNPDDETTTHVFSVVTKSERDAEPPCASGPYSCVGDGVESPLDQCQVLTNLFDDGRTFPFGGDPDIDGIDAICDPDPAIPGAPSLGFSTSITDVDADGYLNRGDNCALIPNGLSPGPDATFGTADDVPIGTNNQKEGAIEFAGDPFMPASLKTPLVGALGPTLFIGFDEAPLAPAGDTGPRTDDIGADCDDSDGDGTPDSTDFDDDGDGIPDICDVGGGPLVTGTALDPGIALYCSAFPTPGTLGTTASGPGISNGHFDLATPTVGIAVGEHGVELRDLNGPDDEVANGGSAVYTVDVKNEGTADTQDIEVAVRVLPDDGCVTVNSVVGQNSGTATAVAVKATASVSFTVDWSGCPSGGPGNYTVQADACHSDDAGAGFYGVGDCPGADDGHGADTKPVDDAPVSINVVVNP